MLLCRRLCLLQALGISSTNFKGLSALTVICALSNLLPLCLIWMIPAKVEGPSLLLPSKHVPRRLPQKTDDGASTTADSDGGAAETSANNSDMEAGSVWRANIGSGLTRRGTVQVVDGGPEERYSPVSSHDSFAALGSVGGMLSGCRSPSEEIFESGGSGECAVSPQPRW